MRLGWLQVGSTEEFVRTFWKAFCGDGVFFGAAGYE